MKNLKNQESLHAKTPDPFLRFFILVQVAEHATMNDNLTVLALYSFFYAQERFSCHS